MKKRIICSSCAAIASMLAVFCLSAYAVDAPEEETIPCTTTVATTTSCSTTETSRITTYTSSTSATTESATTMITTVTEANTEVNTEPVLDDPDPIVKEERHEELWETEPAPAEVIPETEPEYIEVPETEYVEPTYVSISDSDRYYLAVMVSHECSPRASVEHNATTVACMFNRVRDGWASSIYDAIQTGCVPWWSGGSLSSYGLYGDTDYCYAAIDYYLSHSDEYSWQHSWGASGDGVTNYFY